MYIGKYLIDPPIILAPMAGVTDLPFRQICRKMGAGLAVCEMIGTEKQMVGTNKTKWRSDHTGEKSPISVQIVGANPDLLAEAAQISVEQGADIIDINMGCPAKKVCKVQAGSALMKDEALVKRILDKVVKSVNVPVTLKIRTGWDKQHKNALTIAKIAQDSGICALSIHGRTREDGFKGEVEYKTISEVKQSVSIPVIANGDINSLKKAKEVIQLTNADALMIGRAAMGNPWIFRELSQEIVMSDVSQCELINVIIPHIKHIHEFYGEIMGVRIARKHLVWYLDRYLPRQVWAPDLLSITNATLQLAYVEEVVSKNVELF